MMNKNYKNYFNVKRIRNDLCNTNFRPFLLSFFCTIFESFTDMDMITVLVGISVLEPVEIQRFYVRPVLQLWASTRYGSVDPWTRQGLSQ